MEIAFTHLPTLVSPAFSVNGKHSHSHLYENVAKSDVNLTSNAAVPDRKHLF